MPNDASSPSIPAFEVGQKLAGVYVLRKEISGQANGQIWLAQDEVLGKDVSLHFVPSLLRSDDRAMTELRQEIKRNRQLIHPGILRVYDLVEEPEWSAISMDWFEGESLATLLKARPGGFFEPADVKPWLQQVCHTLDDIHKIQIVHRDVAPHNIFIDTKGKVLLAKFGISRVIEDALARIKKDGGASAHLGSLSPQCLDGENPSKSDDIYSIGATIYELLTGELPFVGDNLVAQIRKNPPQPMMERRAKLGRRGGTILPVWEKWVAAALAKGTADRPASPGELATKLGLSGKLSLESTGTAAVGAAAAAATTAPVSVGEPVPVAAPLPASGPTVSSSSKDPDPAEAPKAKSSESAPSKVAAASTISAIAAATSVSAKEPEKAAESAKALAAAAGNGPGIKLPSPRTTQPPPVEAAKSNKPTGKPPVKPEDLDEDLDEKDDLRLAPSAKDGGPEFTPPERSGPSSGLVFGVLIALVILVAYLLNRSDEPEKKDPTTGPIVNVTPAPATPPLKPSDVAPVVRNEADVAKAKRPEDAPSDDRLSGEPLLVKSATPPATPPNAVPGATPAVVIPATAQPIDGGAAPAFIASGDEEKDYQAVLKLKQQADAELAAAEKAVKETGTKITSVVKGGEQLQKDRTERAEKLKAAEDEANAARQAAEAKAKSAEETRKALADWEAANATKLAAIDKANTDFRNVQAALEEKQKQAAAAAKVAADAEEARKQRLASRQKEAEAAAMAKQKADEEAQAKMAADRAKEAAERERKAAIDDQIRKLREQMEALIKAQGDPSTPLPSPGAAAPSAIQTPPATATPAPKASASPTPRVPATPTKSAAATPAASPAPSAVALTSTPSRTVPPAPPAPVPVPQNGPQSEFLNPPMPAGPVAISTPTATNMAKVGATPRVIHADPPAATPAPVAPPATDSPAAPAGGESSLGLKFAPVGDVAFCVWPTRYRDFEVFAKESGFRSASWRSPGFKQGADHPVVNVSWNDAIAFCKWLTERDRKAGFLAANQIYRLPTDLEWSRAVGLPEETGKSPEARDMGVSDVFPWGTQWPPPPRIGNYTGEETGSDVAIKGYEDGFAWTSPVGTFPPNKLGLYDVGGNVWQWCMDNWSPESKAKVLRGASWYNGALKLSLLSSCRVHANPDSSTDNYGFRVVKATTEQKSIRSR